MDAPRLMDGNWHLRQFDAKRPLIEVVNDRGKGWILKQPSPIDPVQVTELDREAAFYAYAARYPALDSHLPRLRHYDRGVHLLAMEYLPYPNGWDALRLEASDPAKAGRAVGAFFSTLHKAEAGDYPRSTLFDDRPPWILANIADEIERTHFDAAKDLLRQIVKDDAALGAMLDLGAQWKAAALIHGDAKLENLIIRTKPEYFCYGIDWGNVQRGDPLWDLAGVIQSSFALWLSSSEVADVRDPAKSLSDADIPFDRIAEFIEALLAQYFGEDDDRRSDPVIVQCMRCAGARLYQTTFEHVLTQEKLSRRHILMLRFAHAALLSPERLLDQMAFGRARERA